MKEKYIYALGFFDGVHLGHQALMQACHHLAQRTGNKAGVITFANHPDTRITGKTTLLINTSSERSRILLGYGDLRIVELPFDENLRKMPWRGFLEDLLIRDAAGFVCGEDFRFGYGGEGSAQLLAAFCQERELPYAIVPDQKLDGIRVSSTYIRQLLEDGDMEQAVRFLGHAHIISGKVIPGRGLGHTMGIPTANLEIPKGVVCPKKGVYACKTIVDGQEYLAVTNIGSRPTVDGHHVTVEPWILDFDGDLYGKAITIAFFKYLRPEKKFEDLGELKAEIEKNAVETRKFFEK